MATGELQRYPGATARAGSAVARLGGMVLVIVGALFAVLSLLGFLADTLRLTVGGLALLGVLGLALCIGGVLWLRSQGEQEETAELDARERLLMEMAARGGGTVTLPQVVRELSLSSVEAELLLEKLTQRHLFELDLAADGTVLYRFKGLPSRSS